MVNKKVISTVIVVGGAAGIALALVGFVFLRKLGMTGAEFDSLYSAGSMLGGWLGVDVESYFDNGSKFMIFCAKNRDILIVLGIALLAFGLYLKREELRTLGSAAPADQVGNDCGSFIPPADQAGNDSSSFIPSADQAGNDSSSFIPPAEMDDSIFYATPVSVRDDDTAL